MKVGILTFPNSKSYGATLQMYALSHTVRKLGHDAEIVNYFSEYMKNEGHLLSSGKSRSLLARLKKGASRLLHLRMKRGFSAFEKKRMTLYPKKQVSDRALLPALSKRYDALICGSDQVWNPDITNEDLSYFLDFCTEHTRRIAYAPSFGVRALSDGFAARAGEQLALFNALSVREEAGGALVHRMIGKTPLTVVDPTMLVSREEWSALERAHPAASGEYILYYTIRRSESLMARCRALSRKMGIRVVVVGGNALKRVKNSDPMLEYAVDPSPEEWLYLLHHARLVMTNSFHGTAFSIIYRKDFFVELSSATNSRLEQITSMLGLESRVLQSGREASGDLLSTDACDYTEAERCLDAMCAVSMDYLKKALS